ncbi:amino acid adenylation domain-containing protein [Gordonia sp. CPCC 206044]|uniref:non-ribosomal peptide synthetase n=1 Tax=Gordonia sp. CPCC 206044 TaxID=3140793 RepID=UPI003AF3EAD4
MPTLPLDRAQRALWFAQQAIGDDIPLTIAHYVDLTGDLDVERLCRAARHVQSMSGLDIARVRVVNGEPALVLDARVPPAEILRLDFREHPDPVASALGWMDDDAARPWHLTPSEPLVSSALLHVADDRWLFYSCAHHLAVDGYTAMTSIRLVAQLYRDPSLLDTDTPPIAQRWRAVLDAEHRYQHSARYERDLEYWATALTDGPDPVMLGSDGGPVSARRHRAGVDLDDRRSDAVESLARASGLPASAVLLASIAWCVGRLRDLTDVPLTIATSARTTPAVRDAGGTVSNLLPVTVPVRARDSIGEFLHDTAAMAASALRHQLFRYEDMARDCSDGHAVLRHRGPIVNMAPFAPTDLGPHLLTRYQVISTGPVTDVNINVYPSEPGRVRLELEANPNAYTAESTQRLLGALMECLDDLTALHPTRRLLELRSPRPHPAIHRSAIGASTILSDILFRGALESTPALSADADTLTYRELADHAAAVGVHLRDAGARPGDAIAIAIPRSRHSVIAFWGVVWAGGCAVPVDPGLPSARRQGILADARPRLVIHHGHPPPDVPAEVLVDITTIDPNTDNDRRPVECRSDAAAFIMYTSGSTGTPKGVVVTQSGVADLIAEIDRSYGLMSSSVVAHLASPGFDTAIVEMLAAAHRRARLDVVPVDVQSGTPLARHLAAARVTHLFITPALLATVSPSLLPDLTHVVVGGDRCPAPLIRTWSRSTTVRCAYGPTETTCSVLLTDVIDPEHLGAVVPLGMPMSGVHAWVLDRRLMPVPVGSDGELYIAGPSVAMGYLHRTGETAARFVADPFTPGGRRMYRTGDRVRVTAAGQLHFRGRADRQVKVHGVRVELGDVDAALLSTGLVTAAATIAIAGGDRNRLHAFIVPRQPDVDVATVRSALIDAAPRSLVPSTITVVDELPMTVHNKVDPARLPTPHRPLDLPYDPPDTDTEHLVTQSFRDALYLTEPVSATADFFDLGGDSLVATTIIADLNARTGHHLQVRDVFESATPRALAARLDCTPASAEGLGTDVTDHEQVRGTVRVPLSPAQRTIPVPDDGIGNLIPFRLSVDGHLDTASIRSLFGPLLDRHDTLRSTYDSATMTVDATPNPQRWHVDDIDDSEPDWATRYLHRPIDLARHYPIRIGVAHTATETHMAVAFHHIAVDGHSLRLLARSIAGSAPTTVPLPYAEYCRRSTLQGHDDQEGRIDFWRTELGRPHVLRGHTDRERAATWDPTAGRHRTPLTAPEWSDVTTRAHRNRVSPLTVVRAALARQLSALTAQSTILIGALVSGRDDSRFTDTVGMFVTTVPVVCPVSPSADDTIVAVAAAERRAFAHGGLALPELVDALGAHRTDAHPLFQVMLSMDDSADAFVGGVIGDAVRVTPLPVDLAKCDLHVSVSPPTGERDGVIDVLYAAALFDPTTVAGFTTAVTQELRG